MGGAFSSRKMETNQPGMVGVGNLESFAQNQGLGRAGKLDKKMMNQMFSGDYGGLAGGLLSPIHDRYAANQREMERKSMMGGNAFARGTQPALMARLQNESMRQMAEGEGLALSQAIPGLWGQAQGGYQNALNAQRGGELSALQSAMQGRLASNQYVTKPGWLDRVGQVAGMVGGVAGIPGLGGFGRGGGGGGYSANPFGYSQQGSSWESNPYR